jgi:hypothetical protein
MPFSNHCPGTNARLEEILLMRTQKIADSAKRRTFMDVPPVAGGDRGGFGRPAVPEAKVEESGAAVLSRKPRPTQASIETSITPVRAAYDKFVAALMAHPPRTIPADADAIDLEDRADHLQKVLGALSMYLTLILDDTAQNVPGRFDLPNVEGILCDLAADLTGPLQHAAEDMAWGAP